MNSPPEPVAPKPWFVYLVRAANGALYCGISNDPLRRFAMHQSGKGDFLVAMHDDSPAAHALEVDRLGRAIGVIYLPQTERQSHYFHVRPSDQFDAMIHIDSTRALEPLEPTSRWIAGQNPETYPTGL